MATNDLFIAPTNPTESNETGLPEGVKFRDLLVGEGKKFRDDELLAKGKWESDLYIKRLEAEKEEMRKDLEARMSVDEFIKQMKNDKLNPQSPTAHQQPEGERRIEQPQEKAISADDLTKLVEEKLSQRDEQKQRKENVLFARNELLKEWGQTFPERLKIEAQRLGVSEDFLASTAETAPIAFLKLLGVNPSGPSKASTYQAPPRSELNVSANGEQSEGIRKWKEFEELRRTNPRKYWSRGVQAEIHKLATKNGSSFFNT